MSRKRVGLLALGLAVIVVLVSIYPAYGKDRDEREDRVLSKVRFIHFKKGHAKPPWAGGGKAKDEEEGDYTYIAKGAKWKSPESFLLNPRFEQNGDGNLDGLIHSATTAGLQEWEIGDSLEIFANDDPDGGATITIDETVAYNGGGYRGVNTISFGSHPYDNVIGETTVWGYFTGPPGKREIVEAHILFNERFAWGDATFDTGVMDVQNIVTHELGHVAGMGDLYELAAGDETMYGYSTEDEIKKRDLYLGDTTGVTGLYK